MRNIDCSILLFIVFYSYTKLLTSGCSTASTWYAGHNAVSTIVCSCGSKLLFNPGLKIDNIPQIEVQFTLKAKNRKEEIQLMPLGIPVNCSPSDTIKCKCP